MELAARSHGIMSKVLSLLWQQKRASPVHKGKTAVHQGTSFSVLTVR
jgi:hypothetical protein